ncbi:carbon-nitrogen hydrolase family protein, partial [Stieleria sp.]|uniref:carbon-nitrogen hydrolase family protein n=1 Tax=Stieleria sp. TaxID=2795976 RepID=UPI0035631CF3
WRNLMGLNRFPLVVLVALALLGSTPSAAEDATAEGWKSLAPREEIQPIFQTTPSADGDPAGLELIIRADDRQGLSGHWRRSVPVVGGRHYQFSVLRKTDGIEHPRRSAIARVLWRDPNGQKVKHAAPAIDSFRRGIRPQSEPEFPAVVGTHDGWDELAGVYLAPPDATTATIELHFRWGDPHSSVRWKQARLETAPAPPKNLVRLATIHYQPRGGETSMDKCRQFAPLIEQAAKQDADLVVLPETLTYYGTKGTYADAAEPIPGPSTDYFAELAKQHDMYVVAGLLERDGHLIYNVAVLLGPDGNIVGKYRKVCLPRSEIEGGIMPGNEYPVFSTRFGKVGMMVCYDGFFPEVARELANNGADVIAWPVWGCNPLLAQARACENHVYLVSSTYTKSTDNWIRSAIYGLDGTALAAADEFGTIAITEVDLNQTHHWHSLGDFKAQLPAHRPVAVSPVD